MEVGIIGLPGVGKTTLFNALTGSHAERFGERAHVGVANLPDPTLQVLASHVPTEKIVPATVQLVDIPGMPAGGDAKKFNAVFGQIRQVEALCHVVRCFDDGSGSVDPLGDIEEMETEMVLADLVLVDGVYDKAEKYARRGDEQAKVRFPVLQRVKPLLEDGKPVRVLDDLTESDEAVLTGYGFISAKPVLYAANIDEDDLAGESDHANAVRHHAESSGGQCVIVSAKLEEELIELDEADRNEMLDSLGLSEPVVGPLARAANDTLGLLTFYTIGPKEIRAWPVRRGATAPEAAGTIHSDMARGFIRAECHTVDDLIEHGTEKAIRDAGKLRAEGKSYVVQDHDCLHILFNV